MAAVTKFKVGEDCKAYIGDTTLGGADTFDTLTWTELGEIKGDVTVTIESEEIDITTLSDGKWDAATFRGLNLSVEFSIQFNPNDVTNFEALRDAKLAQDPVALAILDGAVATSGSQGPVANWAIGNFNRNQVHRDAMVYDLSFKPESEHAWEEVA